MKTLNVHLVVIDPQNDFMDQSDAALPVPGATADMQRLAAMLARIGHKLDDVHVTLDSHHAIDVAHPGFWRDANGQHPDPFTIITPDDVENGVWVPQSRALRERMLSYAEALAADGKYPLMIWPEHCLIGTPGHTVQADLMAALLDWERKNFANVDFVTKGANPFTEHYGALMAEVPDPSDPSTGLNAAFLQMLAEADIVAVAGEALSHCVKATVDQIAEHIGAEHIKKFHILTDCASPVAQVGDGPDFPAIAEAWLRDMEAAGMVLTTSEAFLA